MLGKKDHGEIQTVAKTKKKKSMEAGRQLLKPLVNRLLKETEEFLIINKSLMIFSPRKWKSLFP